jgi:DNA primase
MASAATNAFELVRQSVRIEDVIGEQLRLKPSGREFVGLCPFHDDHNPSMRVVPAKQIFYCFVCTAGGDVFKFVQRFHKMTAGESLRYLADKYHITLPQKYTANPQAREARENLLAASAWAARQFRTWLNGESGATARNYLLRRGLTPETIETFGLGFSPDNWTALAQAAARDRIDIEHLVDAGLLKKRNDGSPFDVFRHRVIFPIIDSGDRVVAFGGRILPSDKPDDKVGPKYLNSPESIIFNKRDMLYGLNRARSAIIQSGEAILVEGYMDVIGAHQAGVNNVIASLGTAFTPHHAMLLQRIARRLVLVFDTDEAGHRAADRAIELLLAYPIDVCVLHVPGAKDPCDYCLEHGGQAFEELVGNATDALQYKWGQLLQQFQASSGRAQKSSAVEAMMRLLATVATNPQMDSVRRSLLEKDVADLVGMSIDEIHAAISDLPRPDARASEKSPASGGTSVGHPARTIASAAEKAQRWILGIMLADPALYAEIRDDWSLELFTPGTMQSAAAALVEYLDGAAQLRACTLSEFVSLQQDDAVIQMAIALEREADKITDMRQCLLDSIAHLKRHSGAGAEAALPAPKVESPPGGVPQSLVDLLAHRREDHRQSQLRRQNKA